MLLIDQITDALRRLPRAMGERILIKRNNAHMAYLRFIFARTQPDIVAVDRLLNLLEELEWEICYITTARSMGGVVTSDEFVAA